MCRAILISLIALFGSVPVAWGQENLPDLGYASGATLSPQMERAIGEAAMRDIRLRDPNYVDDPELTTYINTLGHRLTAADPQARLDFEFFLVRSSEINAFSMPGGFIGVNTGLVLATQSESELAAVLSHEIAHVTQHHIARMLRRQAQMAIPTIAAMVIAVLAARANPQAAQGAMAAVSAGSMQSQLNYSRKYEEEADRVGFQTLLRAGFDVHAMSRFFKRLQRSSRLYENGAPAYLRTHPLTSERIADMENREEKVPYKQVPSSLEYQLVKAKIRSEIGSPRQAVTLFEEQIKSGRYDSEVGARYGLAAALGRARKLARAERAVVALRKLTGPAPMVELLAARIKGEAGDVKGALNVINAAVSLHPDYRPLKYAQIDYLQRLGEHVQALAEIRDLIGVYPHDARLFDLRAKSYSALGKRLLQHQALAESYALQGALGAAIEQLQLAKKSGDGDFYTLSTVEARIHQLRLQQSREKAIEADLPGS